MIVGEESNKVNTVITYSIWQTFLDGALSDEQYFKIRFIFLFEDVKSIQKAAIRNKDSQLYQ